MDLLELIKEKAEYFSDSEADIGISSIVSHIEIAERHFESGKAGDDYLFNDVIYRSNQAFEGSLKEAYRILTGNNSGRITPHKIEKYFETAGILKERVLQLFTNYRTEWRNKSTHDHKLYFSEQEALLGIVNISAFVNILFDQMIEKRAFENEKASLIEKPKNKTSSIEEKSLIDTTLEIIQRFSLEIPKKTQGTALPRITEIELIGSMSAFISNEDPLIKIISDYSIEREDNQRKYFVDFLIEKQDDKLLIEVKNTQRNQKQVFLSGIEQLLNYLIAANITQGILFIPPIMNGAVSIEKIKRQIGDIEYNIVAILPKDFRRE